MDILDLFTSWLMSAWSIIATNVFTQWGFFGAALFTLPLIRRLIKIFRNTF